MYFHPDRPRRTACNTLRKEKGAEEAEDSANAADESDIYQDKDDEDIYFARVQGEMGLRKHRVRELKVGFWQVAHTQSILRRVQRACRYEHLVRGQEKKGALAS